jgi:hypothetical protein
VTPETRLFLDKAQKLLAEAQAMLASVFMMPPSREQQRAQSVTARPHALWRTARRRIRTGTPFGLGF